MRVRFVTLTGTGVPPRTAGIAIGCLGVLSGSCLALDEAPAPVLLTLTLYNVAATANNAALQGLGTPTLVHAGLTLALLAAAVEQHRRGSRPGAFK